MSIRHSTDCAYLAGMIDGEGHVRFQGYSIRLVVANTDLKILEHLQNQFGGTIYENAKATGNSRQCYSWQVGRRAEIRTLFEGCKSYLVGKKDLGELVLLFCSEPALDTRLAIGEAIKERQRRKVGV
jgi:hypothetical protein